MPFALVRLFLCIFSHAYIMIIMASIISDFGSLLNRPIINESIFSYTKDVDRPSISCSLNTDSLLNI